MQNPLHTSAPAADQVAPAGTLLRFQETPAPSTTDQAAPTSASTAPAKRKRQRTAASRQPAATSTPAKPIAGGVRKISDTPQAVQQLDTPANDDIHHPDAIRSARAQPDVSDSARISHLCGTGGAGADISTFGAISRGGNETLSPAGAPGCRPTPSKTGDTTRAAGDALKTQQVDQVAGQAARRFPNGGARIAPPTAAPGHLVGGDYQRHRDDDHPADTWCADLGEFVQATGPPRGTCNLHR